MAKKRKHPWRTWKTKDPRSDGEKAADVYLRGRGCFGSPVPRRSYQSKKKIKE